MGTWGNGTTGLGTEGTWGVGGLGTWGLGVGEGLEDKDIL